MTSPRPAYRKPIRRKPPTCKTPGCKREPTRGERLCNKCKLDIESGRYVKKRKQAAKKA